MKIVATTSLPSVDRPNADRWNAALSRQNAEQNLQKPQISHKDKKLEELKELKYKNNKWKDRVEHQKLENKKWK